jgi:hypothetical protein
LRSAATGGFIVDDNDDRDGVILEQRLSGRSVMAIAKRYRCATSDVDAVIDRRLNFDLNNEMRLKAIKLDVARLEALMLPFFDRATKDRDVAAGTLCVKILERRALLLGLDSPVRIDVTQVELQQAPTRHERIKAALMRLKYGPDWQPPDANGGDSAVAVLSDWDDKKSNH